MIGDYFKVGIQNIREKKLRSWLTMIGIFVSISIIFVLISLSIGLSGFVEQSFEEIGMETIIILPADQMPGFTPELETVLTDEHVRQIEQVSGVKAVTYEIVEYGHIGYRGQERFILVMGMRDNLWEVFEDISYFKIEEGNHLGKGDRGRIVLGAAYAKDLYDSPVSIGDTVTINEKRFRVHGIAETMGFDMYDRIAIILSEDFREIFDVNERVDEIIIRVESYDIMDEVEERIIERLERTTGLKEEDIIILKPEQMLEIFNTILNILTGFLLAVAAVSLLVGAVGISNTMYTSVIERTKEIGTMKAIGAKNKDVLGLFLIESGLLGIVGGIIGVALGFAMAKGVEYAVYAYTGVSYLQIATPIWLITGCIAFSFIVGAVSGSLPALQAARVKPTEALREE